MTTKNTKSVSYTQSETAASAFHLSDTIDWSSLAAQTKNQVLILPLPVQVDPSVNPIKLDSADRSAKP